MIVAAFISDRPEDWYLNRCLAAFEEHVDLDLISAHEVFYDLDHEYGMAGNAQRGFDWATDIGADYLLWCEEDMLFERDVPLQGMRDVLLAHDHLAQCVLKRHPWSAEEVAAGGQMECAPDLYTQCSDTKHSWMEHKTLFSMNPSLIPRDVFSMGWVPGPNGVERSITDACFDVGYTFCYYGRRHDPPYVRHIGHQRATNGWRW